MNAFCKQLLKDVKKFGQETTIHGVFFLVSYKLHPFERYSIKEIVDEPDFGKTV